MALPSPRDQNRVPGLTAANTIGATALPISGFALADSDALAVAIVDANGDQVNSFGGGTQYTDGASAPAHPVGPTLIWDNAGTWNVVSASNPLPVSTTFASGSKVEIWDGTTTANVGVTTDSNMDFLLTGGSIQTETYSTSSSGAGTVYTVSGFSFVSVDIKTTLSGGGTVFQVSNDNTNWRSLKLAATDASDFSSSPGNTNIMYTGGLSGAKYFRINLTGSGGTAAGTIIFSTFPTVPAIVNTGVTGATQDALTPNSNILSSISLPEIFNGTTWDRVRSIVAASGATGVGVQAVGSVGYYTSSYASLASNTYGGIQVDSQGRQYVQAPTAIGTATPANAFYMGVQSDSGNLRGLISGNNMTDGSTNTQVLGVSGGVFNGSTWDRMRGVGGASGATGVGLLAAGSMGLYNPNYSSLASLTYGSIQVDSQGRQYVNAPTATGSSAPANAFQMGGTDGANLQSVKLFSDADANGNTNSLVAGARGYVYNGTNWDRVRSLSQIQNTLTTTGIPGIGHVGQFVPNSGSLASGAFGVAQLDGQGKQVVLPYANSNNFLSGLANTSTTNNIQLIASQTGKIYLTSLSVANTGASSTLITIFSGSGASTPIWTTIAPAGGGSNIDFLVPIATASATGLFFAAATSSNSVYLAATAYGGI